MFTFYESKASMFNDSLRAIWRGFKVRRIIKSTRISPIVKRICKL